MPRPPAPGGRTPSLADDRASRAETAPPEPVERGRPALRPAWATIDLDALTSNLELLSERVGKAALLAVVKADAYGHGAVPVSRALADAGADWLGVAHADEGVELRRAGLELPILVLGACQRGEAAYYRAYRLTPMIPSLDQVELWRAETADWEAPLAVHLKVDTGMTRLGIAADELGEAVGRIAAAPGLKLAGLASHLAEADTPESVRNDEQERLFRAAVSGLPESVRGGLLLHFANSAAATHRASAHFRMVRLGLALYGLDPARRLAGLRPVLSVRARIVLVRDVPAGTRVGYGGTWRAERPARLAIVPLGYADGFSFRQAGGGELLVAGCRVPVAGRVSMDMTAVDVTGLSLAVGDEAVVLGRQGDQEITAWELAERAGTVPWETLCLFGLRLPRRYVRGGV